jgi:hypothetical protein
MALAWPEVLQSQSQRPRPWLLGVNLVFYFGNKVFRDPKEIPYVRKGDVFHIFHHTFLNLGWQVQS